MNEVEVLWVIGIAVIASPGCSDGKLVELRAKEVSALV